MSPLLHGGLNSEEMLSPHKTPGAEVGDSVSQPGLTTVGSLCSWSPDPDIAARVQAPGGQLAAPLPFVLS